MPCVMYVDEKGLKRLIENKGLCKFRYSCDIYHVAERIINRKVDGNVEEASIQIEEVCSTEARKEQLCYLERRKVN
jgi:hypothetical protein